MTRHSCAIVDQWSDPLGLTTPLVWSRSGSMQGLELEQSSTWGEDGSIWDKLKGYDRKSKWPQQHVDDGSKQAVEKSDWAERK